MRKIIYIAFALFIIALVLLPLINVFSYYYFINNQLVIKHNIDNEVKLVDLIFPHSTISLYLQSFLTLIIIVIAIFGDKIKLLFIKPDFYFKIQKDIMQSINESDSNQDNIDNDLYIRLIIFNKGKDSAMNCIFNLDGIYKIGADHNVSSHIGCLPEKFSYSTNDSEITIFPKCEEYLDIAKITSIRTGNRESNPGQNDQELEILSNSKKFKYPVGTEICLSIRCKYSTSQQSKIFILINWCSQDLQQESSLACKILTPEEFKNINPERH